MAKVMAKTFKYTAPGTGSGTGGYGDTGANKGTGPAPGAAGDTTKTNPPAGKTTTTTAAGKTTTTTNKRASGGGKSAGGAKTTKKPAYNYGAGEKGGSVKNHPLPVDAVKGRLDKSDVARAKTYVARLGGKALGRKRTADEDKLFAKYSDRAKSYAKRIDDKTAAAKAAKAKGK